LVTIPPVIAVVRVAPIVHPGSRIMRSPGQAARVAVAFLTIMGTALPPLPGRGGEIVDKMLRGMAVPFKGKQRTPPPTGIDCAVERLATEIDWLENYVDRYGSVVAKEPDVWGQSRLTRYRREYEEQLHKEIGNFQELNQASLSRSDQSYLGLALAVGAAASENGTGGRARRNGTTPSVSTAQVTNLISTDGESVDPVPLDRSAPFATIPGSGGSLRDAFGLDQGNKINLEPTIHLDHLSRYINHLNELRRINEGDDTGDSPGYALNLVRIPVSILPGKQTQRGHGAEITVTADLQLGEDLLPTTFRNLVVNDLVDVIAPSLTFAINDPRTRNDAIETLQINHALLAQAEQEKTAIAQRTFDAVRQEIDEHVGAAPRPSAAAAARTLGEQEGILRDLSNQLEARPAGGAERQLTFPFMLDEEGAPRKITVPDGDSARLRQKVVTALSSNRAAASARGDSERGKIVARRINKTMQNSAPVSAPSGKSRRARLPIPLTQLPDVAGDKQMALAILQTHSALRADPSNQPCIGYMDVRGFLGEELQAAYDFLAQPEQQHFWSELPGWGLTELIRGRQTNRLEQRRCAFFTSLGIDEPSFGAGIEGAACGDVPCRDPQKACCNDACCRPICRTLTAVLAWAILCDSALLNQRLIEDMQESASAKGHVSPAAGGLAGPFYGPNPSPEARRAFNDYVRIRWPIRVFALDPVTQEQNIEDAYSMRRETQIAMALAASRGRGGTQAMMRYARRLETDLATIALNKTAVGFSHGSDTFGWRFYPRVQSPPTRNNLVNFAETLVGSNSTNRDLGERRLEPGQRECTAIIVMPSFVPYATFDVRTNWFSLTHPKSTDLSMRQTVELSRSVKAMQQSAALCAPHAHAYRDGEVARLLRRVEQLDRELPLQSLLTQIPYENTAGGFELFNTGITDLAPQLMGWYGGTGIELGQPTDVFLVGKGFSVLDSQIIAGGRTIKGELLSRQVIRVTIPPDVRTIRRASCTNCVAPPEDACAAATRRPRSPSRQRSEAAGMSSIRRVANVESLPGPAPAGGPQPALQLAMPPHREHAGAEPHEPYVLTAPAVGDCDEELTHPDPHCKDCGQDCVSGEYVDVHLATPYGVSGHLLIPVVPAVKPAEQVEPDPAACALAISPPGRIDLTAGLTKSGRWRVEEYFDATPDTIAVRVPRWFTPPAQAGIRWTVRELDHEDTVVAQFTVPAPHFEAAQRAYVFDGGELRNFIGDTSRPATDKTLRGALKPYLDFVGGTIQGKPEQIEREYVAAATLIAGGQSIPVDGSLKIAVRYAGQTTDE
jgi:hypothetical protein